MCIVCDYNPTIGYGGLHQSGEDASVVPVPEGAQDNVFDFGATSYTYSSTQSSDQNINGVLSGNRWTDTDVSFSFTDGADDYSYTTSGATELSTQQKNSVLYWLDNAAAVSLLSFEEYDAADGALDAPAEATLKFANTTENTTAYAYYPNNGSISGDAWFGNSGDNPTLGNYDHTTVGHELGHALGLSHGHQSSNGFGAMETNFDAMEYSIMTYRSFINGPTSGYTNGSTSYAQTLMMYDIAALQYMYGADFTTNSSDSIYTVNLLSGEMLINGVSQDDPTGNKIFRTVWDGNGNDTYDFSNLTNDLWIDLTPGSYVDLDATGNDNRAYLGSNNYASGHIYNAIQYQGDTRSLIENAIGGSGDDEIIGNAADNTLEGGAGNDTLSGAAGYDVFAFDVNTGADIVVDFQQGYDNVSFGAVDINDLTFDYNGINTTVNYDSGDGSWFASIVFNNVAWQQYSDINTVGGDNWLGTSADETRIGTPFSDTLEGAGGEDTLNGGDDSDSLFGGADSDYIIGGSGSDLIKGGTHGDYLNGGNDGDTLYGETGDDELLGEQGVDTLFGGTGIDILYGGTDNDFLYGGDFGDTLDGDTQDDHLEGGRGGDVLRGEQGADTLLGQNDADTLYGGDDADILDGGEANDLLFGGNAADYLNGRTGSDEMSGDAGTDTLLGENGNDNLYGGTDADVLFGGANNDQLFGGSDSDTFFGGLNDDTLYGGEGDDMLRGEHGSDMLYGDTNSDLLYGGTGNDTMYGGSQSDILNGGLHSDTLYGDAGADILIGERGIDYLYGGNDDDTLFGGAGTDYLYGGAGNDRLIGGADADFFVFTGLGSEGDDTIAGFTKGTDLINIGGGVDFAALTISSTGSGALIEWGNSSVELEGIGAGTILEEHFLFL